MSSGTPQPAFVLVRPQMGENVGAAARAMWNFGLDHMRVVAPRDGWPNSRAVALAAGAGRLLDQAMVRDTTAEVIADAQFVYATTARARDLTKPVLTPEVAMADAAARIARGERVAVLFGPERTGLANDDIARAGAIVSVPVNPAFPSLNLGQCALLMAYEWQRAAGAGLVASAAAEAEGASRAEIEALAAHYEDTLDAAGFFFPEHKAEAMKLGLRNLWSRMALNAVDVRMLHGILRQMERQARRDG
ncbi:MAG: RNA methyltransferase [Rubellimicrobium sp.]|nr:RNA methyltransferase [Rubellimicrobium sp.]